MGEYLVSSRAQDVLSRGRITAPGETPQAMYERVITTIFAVEKVWGISPLETARYRDEFGQFMTQGAFSFGTPTLTNAGRAEYANAALSSCVVIPVDLRDQTAAADKIRSYYRQNMGSGFDFSPYGDPVALLEWLNNLSAQETATGQYDRYIGNMGSLHVSHPRIEEFIQAKQERNLRHFNISVDVDEPFMDAAIRGDTYQLADGTRIDAQELLWKIAQSAAQNGDPGIIYLDRMNRDNPVEGLSAYTSTPPCSEMGLAPGETCQFGYINLAKFASPEGVNWSKLTEATILMTRGLDNAIEVSSGGFPDPESQRLATLKRKIGIGICGLADTLIYYGIPYDSNRARSLARDMLSYINFVSKTASVKLAEERGSCEAMLDRINNKYFHGFLTDRYGQHPTNTVTSNDWANLEDQIVRTGNLRNILTTSLPPTGRASILMGSNSSLEPIFAASEWNDGTKGIIERFVKARTPGNAAAVLQQAANEDTFQNTGIADAAVLKTAKEILPTDHVRMVAAISGSNGIYDEAVSKTINLPKSATPADVMDIFILTHRLGLKNISVYRDGSHANQPQKL